MIVPASKAMGTVLHETTPVQDIELMSSIVQHEANGCSFATKVNVASVILKRTQDDAFPDSVYDVTHDEGQFSTIKYYYSPKFEIEQETVLAVLTAVTIFENTEAVYFYSPQYVDSTTENWFRENLTLVNEVEGIVFMK